MTIPETAAPPGRGKDVLVEFPQDELIAKWEEFFEEMGYLSKIIAIADRFPEERSLLIAFDELNRFSSSKATRRLRSSGKRSAIAMIFERYPISSKNSSHFAISSS